MPPNPLTYQDQAALASLEEASLAHLCRKARAQAARLLEAEDAQTRAILALPNRRDDITALQALMDGLLAEAKDVIFLGVGGSSLGAQALAQLAGWGTPAYAVAAAEPRLHFLDNLDAYSSGDFFHGLKGKGARFVVVSKSGTTLETLAHCLLALDCLRQQGIKGLHRHFLFVVEPGSSPLRALAQHLGAPVWDHDPDLPGRFSVLDCIGILALLASGREAAPLREGAKFVLESLRADIGCEDNTPMDRLSSPLRGAVAALGLAAAGYDNAVLLAYGDRLRASGEWHRQLWMESLGKQNHCASLVCALGPVDQHSQLQAWLEGKQVNWFTLLCAPESGYACTLDAQGWGGSAAPLLHGRDVRAITAAQCHATQQALIANGAPLRRLELRALDGYALGGLFMHFMLETILAAAMLGIDPFGQPAVERLKQVTRAQLQKE